MQNGGDGDDGVFASKSGEVGEGKGGVMKEVVHVVWGKLCDGS